MPLIRRSFSSVQVEAIIAFLEWVKEAADPALLDWHGADAALSGLWNGPTRRMSALFGLDKCLGHCIVAGQLSRSFTGNRNFRRYCAGSPKSSQEKPCSPRWPGVSQ